MSLFTTAEIFIRLTAKDTDGNEHVRELGMSSNVTFDEIFAAAHMNADGSWPTPTQLDGNGALWSHAVRLRQVEDELRALCGGGNF